MKFNPFPLIAGTALALAAVGCKKSSDTSQAGAPSASAPNATAAGNPDEAVALKLRWPVGGRFGYRMELAQVREIPAITGIPGSAPTAQEMNMGQDYSFKVLRERKEGGHEIEVEFKSVNLSIAMGGREMVGLDTRGEAAGEETNPALAPFRRVIGQKLTLLLDASNTLERVEGMTEFHQKVFGDSDGGLNPMASMFDEEYFRQLMSQGRDLPAQPVKPGATWPSRPEVTMGPLGRTTLDLAYTFKGWEQHEQRRCAALTFTGSVGPSTGDPANPVGAMMAVTRGQCSGKSWYDPARGMIIDNVYDQTLHVRARMPVPPGAGPAVARPVESILKQTVSFRLVEDSGN